MVRWLLDSGGIRGGKGRECGERGGRRGRRREAFMYSVDAWKLLFLAVLHL